VRALAAALTVALATAVGACGGGDDDAPTKQEFAKNAVQICNAAQAKLRGFGQNAKTPEQVADAVDSVVGQLQDSVDKLKDLDLPEGAAHDAAEQFVNANEKEIQDQGIPALEDLRDALRKRDQAAAAKALKQLQQIDTKASDAAARKVGATGCVG
jgi:hypothetical protein